MDVVGRIAQGVEVQVERRIVAATVAREGLGHRRVHAGLVVGGVEGPIVPRLGTIAVLRRIAAAVV
jgi:hypothetical protein